MNLTFRVCWVKSVAFSIGNVLKFPIWFSQQEVLGVSSNMEAEMVDNLILLLLLTALPAPLAAMPPAPPSLHSGQVLWTGIWGTQECGSHILLKFCLSVWTKPSSQNHPEKWEGKSSEWEKWDISKFCQKHQGQKVLGKQKNWLL